MSGRETPGWIEVPLGKFTTLQRGFDITKAEQADGPYPVISSSGLKSRHADFMVRGPGVVIGRKGTLGTAFYVDEDYWPHDTTLWVKNFHGNNPRFAYYLLKSLGLERYDCGASNPTLNRNHIHGLPVIVPPLSTQERIASILAAYDDLIENNTRRIAILEEMARALYQEWFVHFRFPGHEHVPLVDSPLGPIPEGWESRVLGDIAHDHRRGVQPDALEPETPCVGLEHIPRRSIALSEWGNASDVQSTKLQFRKGEILFGKIRPYFHKVSVAPIDGVCSSDAIVISAKDTDWWATVLMCVSSDQFVAHSVQTSNGTKMPRANWDVLLKYPTPVPPDLILGQFNCFVRDAVAQIHVLTSKNRNLRTTRDLLLPKLISGEIDVSALPKEPVAEAAD